MSDVIDIVFDGPPGHMSGRFVEVENADGRSIRAGEWIDRGDGFWALRLGGRSIAWCRKHGYPDSFCLSGGICELERLILIPVPSDQPEDR